VRRARRRADGELVVRLAGRVVRAAPAEHEGHAPADDLGAGDGVAVVPGPRPALLLVERRWDGGAAATSAVADRKDVRVTRVPGRAEGSAIVRPATNDRPASAMPRARAAAAG
jgi:hypothetical protein